MEQVQTQIDALKPAQKSIFDRLQMAYEEEQLNGKSMSSQLEEENKAAAEQRSQEADEKSKQKRDEISKLQEMMSGGGEVDMDIDSMPDCRLKYDIIVKRAKAG